MGADSIADLTAQLVRAAEDLRGQLEGRTVESLARAVPTPSVERLGELLGLAAQLGTILAENHVNEGPTVTRPRHLRLAPRPGPLRAGASGRHMSASEYTDAELTVDRIGIDQLLLRVWRAADDVQNVDLDELAAVYLHNPDGADELIRRIKAAAVEHPRDDPDWRRQ